MALRRPGIPAVDSNLPSNMQALLGALKENVEISNGIRSSGQQQGSGVGFDGWKLRSVTLGMLIKAGVLTEAQANSLFNSEP